MNIQYLAGIVDGEGHFCRPNQKNGRGASYPQSRLIITNTHKPLLDAIKAKFGGYMRQQNMNRSDGRFRLPCYEWVMRGKKAEELARKLQPYLIVKAEQVKRVLH